MALLETPELAFCNFDDFGGEADLSPNGRTFRAEFVQRWETAGAQAIDRILRAVGKEYIPPNLDREALRLAIGNAYYGRRLAFDLLGGSKSRQRLKALRRLREAIETPIASLKPDVGMNAMITTLLIRAGIIMPSYPMSPPLTIVAFLEQLCRAIAEAEKMYQGVNRAWRGGHKRDASLRGRRLTQKEWLAGVTLPLLFEMHFLKRAARSRGKAGKPSGPMVRFISATMQELGLTYADESIVKAYSLRTPLRAQRRRGNDILTEIRRQT